MEPSWQPDPTGRHHYRWWDGAAWGDAVADHGETSIDPMKAAPATVTVSTTPRIGQPATSTAAAPPAYATEPFTPSRGIGKWIALAVVVLAAVGVGVYLLVVRQDKSEVPSSTGITVDRVSGLDGYVVRDFTIDDGDAVRFRVEGDPDRDLLTYLIAPDDLATAQALRYYTDYGTNVGITDEQDVLSALTDAGDVLSEGDAQDAVRGYSILKNSDRCCVGVADADSFIATVPGTYRIVVVEADGRDSQVRIIIEKFKRQLFSYAAITDALDNDAFFTDTGFFKDSESYEPDS